MTVRVAFPPYAPNPGRVAQATDSLTVPPVQVQSLGAVDVVVVPPRQVVVVVVVYVPV